MLKKYLFILVISVSTLTSANTYAESLWVIAAKAALNLGLDYGIKYIINHAADDGNEIKPIPKMAFNQYIQNANSSIKKGRLVNKSDSAIQYLGEAYKLDPDNHHVLLAASRLVGTYQHWASSDIHGSRFKKAKFNLEMSDIIIDAFNLMEQSRINKQDELEASLCKKKGNFICW